MNNINEGPIEKGYIINTNMNTVKDTQFDPRAFIGERLMNKVDDGYNHPTQQGLREQQEKNMYEQQENIKQGDCIPAPASPFTVKTLVDVVTKHEKEIQELKGLVTPMMEFNSTKLDIKCAVKGCDNHMNKGLFYGLLCAPCHHFVHGDGDLSSQAYRNSRAMSDTAVEMERERVAQLLEYLDMKAQPYHSYYKHAAKVINGKPEEGGLI